MVNQSIYNQYIEQAKSHNATVVAVSKFQPIEKINQLYEWGHRDFGENYVQELVDKYQLLPKDIQWHFIGHLQRNKVKYIAPFIHLIQSVDSFKLLSEINKCAEQNNRVIDVLLQIYVGEEDTKYGLNTNELLDLLTIHEAQKSSFQHVRIRGIMGMATLTNDEQTISREFNEMDAVFSNMKQQFFFAENNFDILSMGMSSDYVSALDNGSNMVRLGSSIFGNRKI